jgi:hypothetical protein
MAGNNGLFERRCIGATTIESSTMSRYSRLIAHTFLLVALTVAVPCTVAFQATTLRPHLDRCSRPLAHCISGRPSRRSSPLFFPMSNSNEDDKKEETSSVTSSTTITNIAKGDATPTKDNAPTRGGLSRTLVLAVPLMLKFVIVLIIKFLTDLVVFPLLLLYRFARLTKRKVLRLFGVTTTKDNKNSLDGITPNGASPTPPKPLDLAP